MPKFSETSEERLETCHPLLQTLFRDVVQHRDCTVLEGYRSPERQEQMYREGRSKVRSGGKHNVDPSEAADVAPYPIDWAEDGDPKALARFYYFGGLVKGRAQALGIPIRWGGDWDGDGEFGDQRFDDLVHFELQLEGGG